VIILHLVFTCDILYFFGSGRATCVTNSMIISVLCRSTYPSFCKIYSNWITDIRPSTSDLMYQYYLEQVPNTQTTLNVYHLLNKSFDTNAKNSKLNGGWYLVYFMLTYKVWLRECLIDWTVVCISNKKGNVGCTYETWTRAIQLCRLSLAHNMKRSIFNCFCGP
jgi:hypothetical protein